jgi:hypothetical protein
MASGGTSEVRAMDPGCGVDKSGARVVGEDVASRGRDKIAKLID